MSDLQQRTESEHLLSDLEVTALQARIGANLPTFEAGEGGVVSVNDVAEATGMSPKDVADHVNRIRAEAGFRAPEVVRPSPLPWIALGSILVAFGITYWRLQADAATSYIPPTPLARMPPAVPVRNVATTQLPINMTTNLSVHAPSGLRVEVVGQHIDLMDEKYAQKTRPHPYPLMVEQISEAAEQLIESMQARDDQTPAAPGTRYQSMAGGIFEPRPGYVRLGMSGWTGPDATWIAVPLTQEGRVAIRKFAEKVFANVKGDQDQALAPVSDYRQDIVTPPPGFQVQFAGRRIDYQRGPRITFSDLTKTQVANRLEAALLNAYYRDGRPPLGAWSGNAGEDAKIPQPSESRVEISTPDGFITRDIPTDPNAPDATRKAIHLLATQAAEAIVKINLQGLETDPSN